MIVAGKEVPKNKALRESGSAARRIVLNVINCQNEAACMIHQTVQ